MTEIDPHATPNSKIVIVDGMFYEKTSQNTTRPRYIRVSRAMQRHTTHGRISKERSNDQGIF